MNYNSLINKPTLNHKELIGNNSASDIGGMTEEQFAALLNTDLASYYTKAQIDDLFSRSYVYREKSGSIVTFDCPASVNGIDKVVSEIVAVQSGTGDPSPTNVRPFSGWSAVNVYKSRKNLVDISRMDGTTGITYADGVASGLVTTFASAFNEASGGITKISDIKFPISQRVTISLSAYTTATAGTNGAGLRIVAKYTDGTTETLQFANNTTTNTKQSITTAENKTIKSIYFSYGSLTNTW